MRGGVLRGAWFAGMNTVEAARTLVKAGIMQPTCVCGGMEMCVCGGDGDVCVCVYIELCSYLEHCLQ